MELLIASRKCVREKAGKPSPYVSTEIFKTSPMTKSISIIALASTDTPRIVVSGLKVDGHKAIVEVHDPRYGSIVSIGSRRPVDFRLHIGKGMIGR